MEPICCNLHTSIQSALAERSLTVSKVAADGHCLILAVQSVFSADEGTNILKQLFENSFSTLSRVLRPHRQSMSHHRMADLILLSFEKNLTRDIDFELFVKKFTLKSRRIAL